MIDIWRCLVSFLLRLWLFTTVKYLFTEATVSFRWDWSGLPCLVQFLTWLHVSECRNLWNIERETNFSSIKLIVKNGNKNPVFFLSKSSKFPKVWTYDFVQISMTYGTNIFYRNVWRDFRLPISALATAARKNCNCKFTVKINFPIGHFMLPLLMLTLEFLSLWTTCW